MVETNKRNAYFNAFVKEATKNLKNDIGIVMSFYGFNIGVVIKVELKKGSTHHSEDKQEVSDLCDALIKTQLLPKEKCESVRGKSIGSTIVAVPAVNCYVIFKSDKDQEWQEDSAEKDYKRIIAKVLEKYGKQ